MTTATGVSAAGVSTAAVSWPCRGWITAAAWTRGSGRIIRSGWGRITWCVVSWRAYICTPAVIGWRRIRTRVIPVSISSDIIWRWGTGTVCAVVSGILHILISRTDIFLAGFWLAICRRRIGLSLACSCRSTVFWFDITGNRTLSLINFTGISRIRRTLLYVIPFVIITLLISRCMFYYRLRVRINSSPLWRGDIRSGFGIVAGNWPGSFCRPRVRRIYYTPWISSGRSSIIISCLIRKGGGFNTSQIPVSIAIIWRKSGSPAIIIISKSIIPIRIMTPISIKVAIITWRAPIIIWIVPAIGVAPVRTPAHASETPTHGEIRIPIIRTPAWPTINIYRCVSWNAVGIWGIGIIIVIVTKLADRIMETL